MIKLIDFYATWCGPCKLFSPIVEEIAEDKNIELIKVNIDENKEIAKEFNITSVPTIVLLKDNKEVSRNVGFIKKDELDNWINKNI